MERLFIYLTDLTSGVAYFIIFGILVACGLGFPLPEDIPLIAAGYLVWDGTIQLVPAFLVTMVGVLFGDSILFFLGAKFGVNQGPFVLAYAYAPFPDKSSARICEIQLKGWTREKKEKLIKGEWE